MSTLESVAVAAVLSLARGPAVNVEEEKPRLVDFGRDIAMAVEKSDVSPFEGEAQKEATVLSLVAIAFHESGFREDVSDCTVLGDAGRSFTAFQLMRGWAHGSHSIGRLCASPALAATQALNVLGRHAERCKGNTPASIFNAYASGSCGRTSKPARDTCKIWERLAKQSGLSGARCDVKLSIERDN